MVASYRNLAANRRSPSVNVHSMKQSGAPPAAPAAGLLDTARRRAFREPDLRTSDTSREAARHAARAPPWGGVVGPGGHTGVPPCDLGDAVAVWAACASPIFRPLGETLADAGYRGGRICLSVRTSAIAQSETENADDDPGRSERIVSNCSLVGQSPQDERTCAHTVPQVGMSITHPTMRALE